jgi:hypothetical protein
MAGRKIPSFFMDCTNIVPVQVEVQERGYQGYHTWWFGRVVPLPQRYMLLFADSKKGVELHKQRTVGVRLNLQAQAGRLLPAIGQLYEI